MGGTSRRFILAGLVVALIGAGLIGWMWGSDMKSAIEAHAELRNAKGLYYELAFRLGTGDGGSVSKLNELRSVVSAKEAEYAKHIYWHGLYRITGLTCL
jgi:hypothetical protein